MAFSQFHPNVKMSGALIPANYDAEEFWDDTTSEIIIPSLQLMCIQKLICSSDFISPNQLIPPKIMKMLLTNAIWDGRVPIIQKLLKFYPLDTIKVSPPDDYINWRLFAKLYMDDIDSLIIGVKTLFRNFIQPTNNLRYLDLTDIPLRDEQIGLLSSIVTNEKLVNSSVNYTIYLNCIVFNEITLLSLYSAIIAGKQNISQVKIIIRQLHVAPPEYVKENILHKLLEVLEPHELQSFSYNFFLECDDFFRSLRHTAIFHSVKVLNLAYSVNCRNNKSFLNDFPYLESLDISGCKIANNLGYLLCDLFSITHKCCSTDDAKSKGLIYLCMESCQLSDESLSSLRFSSHSSTLQNLSLEDNCLDPQSVALLCQKCVNLQILELGDCRFLDKFSNRSLRPMFESFSFLKKLKYLNIAFQISPLELIQYAPLLADIPNLRYLRIPPVISFEFRGTYLNKNTFIDDFHDSIIAHFDSPSRKLLVLS